MKQDFDRGFGIGGLRRHEEDHVPTAAEIARGEELKRQARYCRRCGCSDIFDGAMFTTDPASGICDDCYY
jgi:hypothetical protein